MNYRIALVHGFFRNYKDMEDLENNLMNMGYTVDNLNFPLTFPPIERAIDILKEYLLSLKEKGKEILIEGIKNDEKKVEYLNPNEIELLREEMREESFNVLRDRLMFELLYSSGMTVAELLSLGELNFNLEKREVYLLKNKISRTLYFSQTCKEVYLKFLIAKKEKFKEENNTNIIFVNNSNMRLTDRSVRRLINKYSEKANLQKEVSPYTLRHSFCIYMLKNGMPKEYLAKLLDLKSIGLLDVYENLCKKEIL